MSEISSPKPAPLLIRFPQISAVALRLADLKKTTTQTMHVWTFLQHTMIVVYVLRRTTVHKGYVTPLLLSSVLFVNKVLTLFTCDNGSEKGTRAYKNEHT